jgi:hypothetical protein
MHALPDHAALKLGKRSADLKRQLARRCRGLACALAVIRWGAGVSSDRLRQRARCTSCGNKGASNNTKAQFANSPTLSKEIMNAVMDALEAHTTMSKQAIDSEKVREGLKDVLLGPAQLYEALRAKGDTESRPRAERSA